MTSGIAVAGAIGLAAAVVTGLLAVRARRRARAREARRAVALARLAASMRRAAAELDAALARSQSSPRITVEPDRSAPGVADPATGLPARTAFTDAVVHHVADARRTDRRLAMALLVVDEPGVGLDAAVARVAAVAADAVPDGEPFRVGEHALAVVLPATGRAGALAALARIEATLRGSPPVSGRAVELEPGEDAIAFLARAAHAT